MKRYNPKDIEPKWQAQWDKDGTYVADLDSDKPKYIAMSMFPYPSGAGIHIGHAMNFTISDVLARFYRQKGYESYHPVGWDSFGLPAENYAIKTGVSPQASMAKIIPHYHKQYKAMGWSNDWSKEIVTHMPEYYKWSQWVFSEMYRAGLAYQDARMQWWCTKCQTVLANEQIIDGKCWRHEGADDPIVEKKEVKQWFFKITDYADELLEAVDDLDWTESVKIAQKNWIGRSRGAEIEFTIPKVVMPNPEMARTYIMGQQNISEEDIKDIGGRIDSVTDSGHLCVEFPVSNSEAFEALINEKMEPGFWNEYLTSDEVVFIFKHSNGKLQRFVLSDDNAHEILVLGHQFNNQPEPAPEESPWSWFTGNSWYAPVVPKLTVFTTRPDTLFGATFMVLAPEHDIVSKITTEDQRAPVEKYVEQTLRKTEVQRQQEADKKKTGVFTGAYAINPVNNEKIPIWIADYVLLGYGTGAIMAVPAHDERDNEFAKEFDLPIRQVIAELYRDTTNPPQPDKPTVPRKVVCMVVEHPTEKKYLICKPQGGANWSPVMGGIDEGETATEAALRELKEETGYTDIADYNEKEHEFASEFFAQHKDENRVAFVKTVFVKLKSLQTGSDKAVDADQQELKWVTEAEYRLDKSTGGMQEVLDIGLDKEMLMVTEGLMINSGKYDGLPSSEMREKIVADLEKKKTVRSVTNYKMRDWSVSRQRYWGAPIPIINCPKDGHVLVPDDQLPVVLPELTDFQPSGDGRSALARAEDWLHVVCPTCGGPAERETDTLDTYIDSSWYMLRYFDPKNEKEAFNPERANHWMPIDFYNGADHATAHMLYARFVTRFFQKQGLLENPEPFKQFLFNGKVVAADGKNFSKTLGNGPDPLEIIAQGYGADALRTYLMFAAPLELGSRWDPQGVPGAHRFLSRIWTLVQEFLDAPETEASSELKKELLIAVNKMIYKVTHDVEEHRYNTAISALMAGVNELYKLKVDGNLNQGDTWKEALEAVIMCVAPFAPHIADELWHQLGHEDSVNVGHWPEWDDTYLISDTVTIAVQVNGKVRGTVDMAAGSDQTDIELIAKQDPKVAGYIDGHDIKKVIYIQDKILNIVI